MSIDRISIYYFSSQSKFLGKRKEFFMSPIQLEPVSFEHRRGVLDGAEVEDKGREAGECWGRNDTCLEMIKQEKQLTLN